MTKTKAAAKKAAAPAQPPAPPPADTPPADNPVNPVHDEAGAPPQAPVLSAHVRTLAEAQALPEVGADADTLPISFVAGSIQRFKASDTDRRTMEVVAMSDGSLAMRVVAAEEG